MILILTYVIITKRKKNSEKLWRKVFDNFWTFDLRGEELIEIASPVLVHFF